MDIMGAADLSPSQGLAVACELFGSGAARGWGRPAGPLDLLVASSWPEVSRRRACEALPEDGTHRIAALVAIAERDGAVLCPCQRGPGAQV